MVALKQIIAVSDLICDFSNFHQPSNNIQTETANFRLTALATTPGVFFSAFADFSSPRSKR